MVAFYWTQRENLEYRRMQALGHKGKRNIKTKRVLSYEEHQPPLDPTNWTTKTWIH